MNLNSNASKFRLASVQSPRVSTECMTPHNYVSEDRMDKKHDVS